MSRLIYVVALPFIALAITVQQCFGLLMSDSKGRVVPLLHLNYNCSCIDFMATVEITMEFQNIESDVLMERVEFYYPIDPNAAIFALTITHGDVVIQSVLHETVEASRIYDAATKEGRSASLMQQVGQESDVYKVSIGNLRGGEIVKIEISYIAEAVLVDAKILRFSLPVGLAERYECSKSENGNDDNSASGLRKSVSGGSYIPIKVQARFQMSSEIMNISTPNPVELMFHPEMQAADAGMGRDITTTTAAFTSEVGDFVLIVERAMESVSTLWL